MTHEKKPFRCSHCGHAETKTVLLRTHCPRCGKPLKTDRPFLPEIARQARTPPPF